MNSISTISLFLVLAIQTVEPNQKPCIPKSYGLNSIVCVCNQTYCDNIPRPQPIPKGQYISYTSTLSGFRFKRHQGNFQKISESKKNGALVININSTRKYQIIAGWGGAFTDSTGININSLNSTTADQLLRSYFSREGLEYNLCRVPMGGTDFSTRAYSYDDGNEDPELSNFKLQYEDYTYKIPLIRRAQNLTGKLELFASVWTAPKWMKYNGKYTGPDFLKKSMYQPWANYYLKFLKSYKEEGIDFWGITTGNEPFTGLLPTSLNSVGWLPWQMRKWVAENLGPTIRNSEFSNLKIIGIDDQIFFYSWYIDMMFEDERVEKYMDGFGLHWYCNGFFPYSVLTKTHNKYSDKFILATEACKGSSIFNIKRHVRLGEWDRAEAYAKDIIEDLNNWVVGWIDWNMALDLTGGPNYINNNVDSPIIVNAAADEFYKQPMYYALGHFSKFLSKGSQRIYVKQEKGGTDVVAFIRPDNAIVVVIMNRNNHDVVVTIKDQNNAEILEILSTRSISTFLYW